PHYSVHESMSAVERAALICRTWASNFAKQSQSRKPRPNEPNFDRWSSSDHHARGVRWFPKSTTYMDFRRVANVCERFCKTKPIAGPLPNEAKGRRSTWFRGAAGA